MGRIHQQDGQLAEATQQYDAVLADYTKQRATAVEALKKPDQFRNNPEEKARLWPKLTDYYKGWAYYQTQTDREIPVVVLRPS